MMISLILGVIFYVLFIAVLLLMLIFFVFTMKEIEIKENEDWFN
jgi:uncharacterized protein YpmB